VRERRARCPGETEQDRVVEAREGAGEDRDSAEEEVSVGWAELQPDLRVSAYARAVGTRSRIRGESHASRSPALNVAQR